MTDYKPKLNIKAITLAEHLLGRAFSDFDFADQETNDTILYSMAVANSDYAFSQVDFSKVLKNAKLCGQVNKEAARAMEYMAQFQKEAKDSDVPRSDGETISVTRLANLMIVNGGIDPDYVMYRMDLHDIPDVLKAIDDFKKDKMEAQRLWAWFAFLPHAGKNCKKPSDMYAFPWEVDELKRQSEEELEEGYEKFQKIINNPKLNPFNGNKR